MRRDVFVPALFQLSLFQRRIGVLRWIRNDSPGVEQLHAFVERLDNVGRSISRYQQGCWIAPFKEDLVVVETFSDRVELPSQLQGIFKEVKEQ